MEVFLYFLQVFGRVVAGCGRFVAGFCSFRRFLVVPCQVLGGFWLIFDICLAGFLLFFEVFGNGLASFSHVFAYFVKCSSVFPGKDAGPGFSFSCSSLLGVYSRASADFFCRVFMCFLWFSLWKKHDLFAKICILALGAMSGMANSLCVLRVFCFAGFHGKEI